MLSCGMLRDRDQDDNIIGVILTPAGGKNLFNIWKYEGKRSFVTEAAPQDDNKSGSILFMLRN